MSEPNDRYIEQDLENMKREMVEYHVPIRLANTQAAQARAQLLAELREWAEENGVECLIRSGEDTETMVELSALLAKLDELEKGEA